jgi:hypothetical protein
MKYSYKNQPETLCRWNQVVYNTSIEPEQKKSVSHSIYPLPSTTENGHYVCKCLSNYNGIIQSFLRIKVRTSVHTEIEMRMIRAHFLFFFFGSLRLNESMKIHCEVSLNEYSRALTNPTQNPSAQENTSPTNRKINT